MCGGNIAISMRKKFQYTKNRAWAYGTSTIKLQQLAIKILSLTSNLSSCECNSSVFGHVINLTLKVNKQFIFLIVIP